MKTAQRPFSRVSRARVIGHAVTYRHPTKGLRTRRLTPQLAIALMTATTPA